jgi:hypothetical protein
MEHAPAVVIGIIFGAAALRQLAVKPRPVPRDFLQPPKLTFEEFNQETSRTMARQHAWYRELRGAEWDAIQSQSSEKWQALRSRAIEKWQSDEQARVEKERTAGKWLLLGLMVALGSYLVSR